MRRWLVLVIVSAFCACVPLPESELMTPGSLQPRLEGTFPPLDAGAAELDSLHFRVRAYGQNQARQVSDVAEAAYSRIMVDTNLFSFRPRDLYEIVVYGSPEEYRRKTGQPEWSGGCAVGHSIYTYVSSRLSETLSHEMTHLVWYEYMGRVTLDHRWVNEGLAVYEENKAAGAAGGRSDIFSVVRGTMRQQPLGMDQMINLVPATERERTVNLWYAQAESMVRFMVERGGRMGFSQFLASLKDGRTFDQAIGSGFPGNWRNLSDFEQSWLRSLQ
jgi:hypothetical protein